MLNLKEIPRLELPAAADMHVHLRQDKMMELVVPEIKKGGVDTVYVMPNLIPPVTTVDRALEYKKELEALEPGVNYLMSLYLHKSITPDVIRAASAAGISGVKVYPQGVTTNSDSGVTDLSLFFPVFAAMQDVDMVLNIHGESPQQPEGSSLTLEEAFLPTLDTIHSAFPKLRIVLEHCTTAAAVEAVRKCGPTVSATITAHHLYLTSREACCDPLAFCKPMPKQPNDRDALVNAVVSGDSKFFFGTDSAPHPRDAKAQPKPPAGVFTQPYAVQYVLLALEEAVERGVIAWEDISQEKLEQFFSGAPRAFYKLPASAAKIVLERKGETVRKSIKNADGSVEVALSRPDAPVWSVRWL
ncbi:putative dihydroorotase [Ceratocystis lukuohia]|uniref:dihydroorotase n=1 Tax=Ceratocystis lukuohia TaxID=2019550 RepID=A0ABR4MUG6_9PEZI